MNNPVLKSPYFWVCLIVGGALAFYREPEVVPYEGTYAPYPITDRMRRHDSLSQLRDKNPRVRTEPQNTQTLYEVEAYIDGKWVKIQKLKIKGLEKEEVNPDLIYDQMEGK